MSGALATNDALNQLRDDLKDDIATLREDLLRVGNEIKARQDKTNGRLDKHDERHTEFMRQLGEHARVIEGVSVNVEHLSNEVFLRPRREAQPAQLADKLSTLVQLAQERAAADDKPMLTRGEARAIGKVANLLWAIGGALVPILIWWFTSGKDLVP